MWLQARLSLESAAACKTTRYAQITTVVVRADRFVSAGSVVVLDQRPFVVRPLALAVRRTVAEMTAVAMGKPVEGSWPVIRGSAAPQDKAGAVMFVVIQDSAAQAAEEYRVRHRDVAAQGRLRQGQMILLALVSAAVQILRRPSKIMFPAVAMLRPRRAAP